MIRFGFHARYGVVAARCGVNEAGVIIMTNQRCRGEHDDDNDVDGFATVTAADDDVGAAEPKKAAATVVALRRHVHDV